MRISIGGYVVERLGPNLVRVEGKGAISDNEAREILGIDAAKRRWEMMENEFRRLG